MANVQKKNVYFVDTTGTLTVSAISPIIYGILITPSADNSRVVIKESVSGTVVLDVKVVPTESRYLSFVGQGLNGIQVTSSFEVSTLTNITSVMIYGGWLQPVMEARG